MFDDKKKVIIYLKRLKHGKRCFEELVRCATGYVGFVVYKYLSDKSFMADAISSTFVNVVRYIHTMDEDGNPFAWLCKIAQNEAYKINNAVAARQEVSLDAIGEAADERDNDDRIAEVIDLYRAIDSLEETDRLIIEYIYFDEKKYKDIAAELNISVGDVSYRKNKALKQLLKLLTE